MFYQHDNLWLTTLLNIAQLIVEVAARFDFKLNFQATSTTDNDTLYNY
jgi:hypothetical protein